MAYIANKPIRFDRDYHIGEIIPETVINPMMARKLTDMGKIICVTLPTDGGAETPPDSAGQPVDGTESTDGINTQEDTENAPEGQNEATEGNAETEPEGAEAVGNAETAQDSVEQPIEGVDVTEGINIQDNPSSAPEGESGAPEGGLETAEDGKDTDVPATEEFICDVCGKTFKSQQGLAAHSRTHKQ